MRVLSLGGTRTLLWELRNSHIPPLQRIITDPIVGRAWRTRGFYWSPAELQARLAADAFLVATITSFGDPDDVIGLVELLDYSAIDQRVHLSLATAPRTWSTGVSIDAALTFLRFAFEAYPIEKVAISTHAANDSLIPGLRRLAHHEATFVRHLNILGEWLDVEVFALFKNDLARLERILTRAPIPTGENQ